MALDFSLSREQEEIRDLAHEFAEKEMRPVADRYDENEETPWEVMRKAHELGLDATATLPEAVRRRRHRPAHQPGEGGGARLG